MEKEKIGCEIPCNMTGEYNLGSNTPSSHPTNNGDEKLNSDVSDKSLNLVDKNVDDSSS